MMSALGSLLFTSPWILTALAALPVIWLILRITPPMPKTLIFPAARFLDGLIPDSPTTAKTPWWILLLRLMITALIILALAGPVLHPETSLTGDGPVYLIIDNDWAAAPQWNERTKKAQDIITQAGRQNREIHITTTAPEAGENAPVHFGPLTATEAKPVLQGLKPLPWSADYAAVENLVEKDGIKGASYYWFSHGLSGAHHTDLLNSLSSWGSATIYRPEDKNMPLLLRPSQQTTAKPAVLVEKPEGVRMNAPVSVQVLAANGQSLDSQTFTFKDSENVRRVLFDIPDSLRSQMTQIRLVNQKSAGGVLLLDNNFKRRQAGIAAPSGTEESIPFIEAQYYLEKALEPFAYIKTGTTPELIKNKTDVIFLPDVAGMPPGELNELDQWVKNGGVIVRFAGPNMAQSSNNELLPAPLLKGTRSLEGTLTWDDPAKLAPFPEDSPLYGIAVSDEISIRQQLLTAPSDSDKAMSWATLADGTPLITAAQHNQGLIIFVHTTATAEWSDLVLSGTFIQILKRIMALSPGQINTAEASGVLQPILYIDGNGSLKQPAAFIMPFAIVKNKELLIDSAHPPGFYGRTGYEISVNLGDHLPRLTATNDMPLAVNTLNYTSSNEKNLKPLILLAALMLFFIDWLVMLFISKGLARLHLPRKASAAAVITLFIILLGTALPACAQPDDQQHMKYANKLHLAYIETGDPRIDNLTRAGLEGLADVLKTRTSVEPEGVVALNADRDEMAFFPIIYWAISPQQQNLSDQAIRNLQNYMDHGGTILIDTREPMNRGNNSDSTNQVVLRRIMGSMNIPPLKPIDNDHVLGRSFYLLRSFPGIYEGATIWVEDGKSVGRDGVSPIIIGSHDWAGAWAASNGQLQMIGGNRQQELSLRFGVNLVMYALTGNYKADQVHLPYILERLDQ